MLKKTMAGLIVATSIMLPAFIALAHDNAELAKETGPHGGMVQMSGNYHLEIAIKADVVTVWVADHSNDPQPTKGATGKATIFKGAERIAVELTPEGKSEMRGTHAGLGDGEGARVVLDLSIPEEDPMQVRYQLSGH